MTSRKASYSWGAPCSAMSPGRYAKFNEVFSTWFTSSTSEAKSRQLASARFVMCKSPKCTHETIPVASIGFGLGNVSLLVLISFPSQHPDRVEALVPSRQNPRVFPEQERGATRRRSARWRPDQGKKF